MRTERIINIVSDIAHPSMSIRRARRYQLLMSRDGTVREF